MPENRKNINGISFFTILYMVIFLINIVSCSENANIRKRSIEYNNQKISSKENFAGDITSVTGSNANIVATKFGVICKAVNNVFECNDIFGVNLKFAEISQECINDTQCYIMQQRDSQIYVKNAYFCEKMANKRVCEKPLTDTCVAGKNIRLWFNLENTIGTSLVFEWYIENHFDSKFDLPSGDNFISTSRYTGSVTHYIPEFSGEIMIKVLDNNSNEIARFFFLNDCQNIVN